MAKGKTSAYCFSAFAVSLLLLTAAAGLGMEDTVARVDNDAMWQTVMPAEQEITSNCLVPGGQTILLGDVDVSEENPLLTIEIELTSRYTTTGEISFFTDAEVDEALLEPYLVYYTNPIELTGGEPVKLELDLIPTVAAEMLTEAKTVTVDAVFTSAEGQELTGTFSLLLQPMENSDGEDETGAEQEPGEGAASGTETTPESGAGEGSGEEERNDAAPTEKNNGGNGEAAEASTEKQAAADMVDMGSMSIVSGTAGEHVDTDLNEVREETGGNGEGAAMPPEDTNGSENGTQELPESSESIGDGNEQEGTNTEDPNGGSSDITLPDEPVEDNEPPEDEEKYDKLSNFTLDVLPCFLSNGTVPVTAYLSNGCTRFTLSLQDSALPPLSRYSLDYGETWFMLYYGGMVDVALDGETIVDVLLDFSFTGDGNWGGETIPFFAVAYAGSGWYEGEAMAHLTSVETMSEGKELIPAETFGVLAEDTELYFPVNTSLEECDWHVSLEMLTEDLNSDQIGIVYQTVDEGVSVVKESEYVVSLSVAEQLPPAGTYRLTIEHVYNGWDFARSQFIFFINYANDAQQGVGGVAA